MEEKLKERKGITLIALVVTIIVLLILAGVTIALVLGDNGIIKRAQEAKEQTAQTQNKEMEDLNNLENYMNEKIEGIVANNISKAPETYYGKEVKGYELPSGTTTDVKWKIFYADGNNIYLIADKYVERENLPNSTTTEGAPTENKPNDGDSKYARTAYFTNILNDYAGSASITDAKLQALNNDYFTKKYTSTNDNMKSVAYMMDTNAWNSKFKDENKAEYVIGGPTVEILFKSYNGRYKTAYESQAASATGYQIRKTSSDIWIDSIASMLSTNDSLYVIKEQTDALAYWLASPSANITYYIMSVYCNGYVYYNNYDNNFIGFRPLVCLKSDIQLQKNEDGTYTIL